MALLHPSIPHSRIHLTMSPTPRLPLTLHVPTLLLAAVVAATPTNSELLAQSALPGYAPTSGRYRVEEVTKQSQQQMGQTMGFTATKNQVVRLTVTQSGTALSLSMTTDSATATATAPAPTPDVSGLIGATTTGSMGPDGHMVSSTVTDKGGSPADAATALAMRSFLPRLKVGATRGTSWADTTSTKGNQNGAEVSTVGIVTYTLAGDTTVAGVRGWKLTSTATGTIDGAGNSQGADFTIKGTMTAQGVMVIGAGGVFLGGTNTTDIKMTVDVPMASMQIPITQQTTKTYTRLPSP